MHDARHDEMRLHDRDGTGDGLNADWSDDVTVAMRLEQIRPANGKNPIQQHPSRRGVHHALPHARFEV